MTQVTDLIEKWRAIGPVEWAESEYGWIGIDGKPITLLPWQRAALNAWWEHRETTTTLALSNVKKTGKTLLDGVMLAWRWLALPGLHMAIANSLDQAVGRQFLEISDMVTRHPYLAQTCIITQRKLVFQPANSVLQALSADYAGAGGANFLTSSHTEAWAIVYEGDRRLWEELTPVPGKFWGFPCLRVVDSYAGYVDESETWHGLVDRGLKGEAISADWPIYRTGGLVLFHMEGREAQNRCFRGDDAERHEYYAEQRSTLRSNSYLRLHENIRVANIGNFVDQEDWETLIDPRHKPLMPGSKEPLYIGLDLATAPGGDNCALIGVYNDDGQVKVGLHKVWEGRNRLRKLSLLKDVYPYIASLAEKYTVAGIYYDPYQAQMLAEKLRSLGVFCVEISQNRSKRAPKDTRLYEMVGNRELVLYDDPTLRYMPGGAAVKELPDGKIFLTKAGGRAKIDLLVALANVADECLAQSRQGWYYVPDPFEDWQDPDIITDEEELRPHYMPNYKSMIVPQDWGQHFPREVLSDEEQLGKEISEHIKSEIRRKSHV